MLEEAFSAAGLIKRLDALLFVEEVGIFKPAPEVYQLGCDHYQARPKEILFVSNNGWDAAAADLFGYHTIWVNRAGSPTERLPMPMSMPAGPYCRRSKCCSHSSYRGV